jgi:hypothetical protein
MCRQKQNVPNAWRSFGPKYNPTIKETEIEKLQMTDAEALDLYVTQRYGPFAKAVLVVKTDTDEGGEEYTFEEVGQFSNADGAWMAHQYVCHLALT